MFVSLVEIVYLCRKIGMKDDILESVSQRGDGAYDAENLRIQEVSDELQRLCRIYEEESRDGKTNGKQSRFEIEQRVAEQSRTKHIMYGMWFPVMFCLTKMATCMSSMQK